MLAQAKKAKNKPVTTAAHKNEQVGTLAERLRMVKEVEKVPTSSQLLESLAPPGSVVKAALLNIAEKRMQPMATEEEPRQLATSTLCLNEDGSFSIAAVENLERQLEEQMQNDAMEEMTDILESEVHNKLHGLTGLLASELSQSDREQRDALRNLQRPLPVPNKPKDDEREGPVEPVVDNEESETDVLNLPISDLSIAWMKLLSAPFREAEEFETLKVSLPIRRSHYLLLIHLPSSPGRGKGGPDFI